MVDDDKIVYASILVGSLLLIIFLLVFGVNASIFHPHTATPPADVNGPMAGACTGFPVGEEYSVHVGTAYTEYHSPDICNLSVYESCNLYNTKTGKVLYVFKFNVSTALMNLVDQLPDHLSDTQLASLNMTNDLWTAFKADLRKNMTEAIAPAGGKLQ